MIGRPPTTLAARVECSGSCNAESLAALEALVTQHPEALDLRFALASMLDELGWIARARSAYRAVLDAEPTHFGALTNLGALDLHDGALEAATTTYETAARAHPERAIAFANLGNALALAGRGANSRAAYERALSLDPRSYHAQLGLAVLDEADGDRVGAHARYQAAFAQPLLRVVPYRGDATPLRVLVLIAANGGNLVTTLLFDDRRVETVMLVVESAGTALPAHTVIVNAIADADRSGEALTRAGALIALSRRPVINAPPAVRATGRLEIAQRLQSVPDVVAPRIARLTRAEATADVLRARGFDFPLLVRAAGYHAGTHFERVEEVAALAGVVARLPGEALFAIEPLATRGADERYRKYRVLFVGDALYPVHLAIANEWKVHYFSSELRTSAAARDEERAFLDDMPGVLGPRTTQALEGIRVALGLDYGGIDFSLDAEGRVLVFEANASMAVYLPEPDPAFDYRRSAVAHIREAFDALLAARAREHRR